MANKTPARGRLRVGANRGAASSSRPRAARSRSVERSRGLGSRLRPGAGLASCLRRLGSDVGAAGGGIGLGNLFWPITDSGGEGVLGKRGRVSGGAGFQPRRRRILRIVFSFRPSRPPIQRLLIPLALRRRMLWSRVVMEGGGRELTVGRPDARAKSLSPPDCRRF